MTLTAPAANGSVHVSARRSFFAGCASGLAGCVVGHPFDTIKLVQQTSMSTAQSSLRASASKLMSGGFRTFWLGLAPALAVQALTCGFLFGAQAQISAAVANTMLGWRVIEETDLSAATIPSEYRLQQAMAISSVSCASLSGFLTGGVLSPLVCPLEAIKCRSQVAAKNTSAVRLFSASGLASLYSGYTATVTRCSVGNAAFFGVYALTRQSDYIGAAFGGALAGTSFWIAAMPFDVVKSRMQTAQDVRTYYVCYNN